MAKKKEMLRVVEKALGKFVENLNDGKVEMNTSVDLDRLVKLSLLLTGEADTIVGKTGVEETTEEGKFDTSYIEQILDTNDPEVINMYNKLYSGMNKVNDEAE